MVALLFEGRTSRLVAMALAVFALLVSLPTHAGKKGGKAWLGISMSRVRDGGVRVEHVFKTSPAAKAKLKKGDKLLKADDVVLESPRDLVRYVQRHKPGHTIKLVMRRGGKNTTVKVKLAHHPGSDKIARLMHVGNKAYELKNLLSVQGGAPASIKDLKGQVVLLEFFASWCTNCKTMTPAISKLHRKFKGQGLKVLGITSDNTKKAAKVVKDWKIPYDVASDSTTATFSAYSVSSIPAVFIIDRKGVIREVMIGYDPKRRAATEKLIKKLLAEKAK